MIEQNGDMEQDLLERLKYGQQEALSELYYLYSDRLLYYVQRTARSPYLAEDIVHDTFMKIWQHRDQLDPSKPFKPYLFVIARRTLLDFLRRAKHEADILAEIKKYTNEEDHTTEQILAYSESNRLINQAISCLSTQVKKTFILCKVQGLTYKQAAEVLKITESTVNKHMSKAIHSIREQLGDHADKLFLFFFICYWMFFLSQSY
jgi:RNA polymerase sigma-70 factor (family 1)